MKLVFHGAAKEVTGSCHLLEVGGKRVLLDCGLVQGGGKNESETRNALAFPFEAASIDAVVLSHAHIDHSGRLPLLIKRGFTGRIHAQHATVDLCDIMLRDAAFLNEKDAELDSRKRARRGLPPVEALYDTADVEDCMRQFSGHAYGEMIEIALGIKVRFRDAGHIVGSCIVEVFLEENGVRRKLVFSGDLGHPGSPILRNPEFIEEADLVLCEATYGDRCHRSWEATWQELGEIFRNSRAQQGNILIPSFAIGRTQDLLYVFAQHFKEWGLDNWQIFLDSPMAIKATRVYTKHWQLYEREAGREVRDTKFRLPNLHFTETSQQSMALNERHSGCIIIAGSGMCTGGRIRHHFKHNLWRSGAQVLMVGFQARGTPGRALVDGVGELNVWGEPIKVAASIHTIGGLSAHADQKELVDWLEHFRSKPPVMLVHGENGALAGLRSALEASAWPQVGIAEQGMSVDLAGLPTLKLENQK